MVLVAAVAAAVLINTTGTLQQRAQATGKEATQEVSSNLKVVNVYGIRALATDNIQEIKIAVQLSAGALPMDLEQLIIRYSDGSTAPANLAHEAYDGSPATDAVFQANWIRESGGANGAVGNSVMQAGDLVELHFTLASELAERSDAAVSLIPEAGSAVSADFSTPATFADQTTITLR